jgi:hypothetical protein
VAPSPFDGSALDYDTAGRARAAYAVLRDRGPVVVPAAPRGFALSVTPGAKRVSVGRAARVRVRVTPPGRVALRVRGARASGTPPTLLLRARVRGRHRVTVVATSAGTRRVARIVLVVR